MSDSAHATVDRRIVSRTHETIVLDKFVLACGHVEFGPRWLNDAYVGCKVCATERDGRFEREVIERRNDPANRTFVEVRLGCGHWEFQPRNDQRPRMLCRVCANEWLKEWALK